MTEINCQKRSACGAIFGNCEFSLACKQFKKYINYTRQQEIRLTDYSTFLPENGHLSEKLPNRRLKENPNWRGRSTIEVQVGRHNQARLHSRRRPRHHTTHTKPLTKMADDKPVEEDEELLDYEEEEVAAEEGAGAKSGEAVKKGYVGIHSTGFRDFLLKPELLRSIVDCGFEHPSEGKSIAPPAQSRSRAHARSDRALAIGAGN